MSGGGLELVIGQVVNGAQVVSIVRSDGHIVSFGLRGPIADDGTAPHWGNGFVLSSGGWNSYRWISPVVRRFVGVPHLKRDLTT